MPLPLTAIATASISVGCATIAAWRWLRVSQREHYHPGRVTSVAGQWARVQPARMAPLAAGAILAGIGLTSHAAAPALIVAAAGIAALSPHGLPVRNTDQKLRFTSRAKRLALTTGLLGAGLLAIRPDGALLALGAVAAPLVVDAAALITKPIERMLSMRFVKQASEKLTQLSPRTIALTGSYGKTTTKNYTAHLLKGAFQTLPTPGSFNNLMGLTRSVNEHMQPGTEIFVAEMGTYGPGEIKELCEWFTPEVAAIVSIGEAHLERMGSRETIVQAKSEILERAKVWILNVDTPELAAKADSAGPGIQVIRCSASNVDGADIAVLTDDDGVVSVHVRGEKVTSFTPDGAVHAINVAVAVAAADYFGVPHSMIAKQLTKLPTVASRGISSRTEGGVTIIDDTFNSNPTGASAALEAAVEALPSGKTLWVVSPGMFELGDNMYSRNNEFASAVFAQADARLVGVGGTNRKAFADAASSAGAGSRYEWFGTRPAAVARVMGEAQDGDVVLYENDRPDHLP